MTSYVYLFQIFLEDYFAAGNAGANIKKLINCMIKGFKKLKMHQIQSKLSNI